MSDEHWPYLYDPAGSASWPVAREIKRADGGDLSQLVDMCPFDREVRIGYLARSNISAERALAMHEAVEQLLAETPDAVLEGFAATLAGFAPGTAPLGPLPRPDWPGTGWVGVPGVPTASYWRVCGGHLLVVRESGSRGRFYAVVDGHHLSQRAEPQTFGRTLDAMVAAEAAIAPLPEPEQPHG